MTEDVEGLVGRLTAPPSHVHRMMSDTFLMQEAADALTRLQGVEAERDRLLAHDAAFDDLRKETERLLLRKARRAEAERDAALSHRDEAVRGLEERDAIIRQMYDEYLADECCDPVKINGFIERLGALVQEAGRPQPRAETASVAK